LAKTLPASAVILGSISESNYHETVDTEHYECGDGTKKKQCTTNTRKGTAKVTANLRLVETATGRVLAQRLSTKTASTDTTGNDDAAPAIDSGSLIDQARAEVAQDFFEVISPHRTTETLPLQFDSDLSLLDRGNDQMKRREYTAAVETYRTAVKQADESKTLDAKVKGKAHYNLAVGLIAIEDFAGGAAELARANQLNRDDDWQVLAERLNKWKNDAELVKKQLAYATLAESNGSTSNEPGKSASTVP
jgi:tetratricopeptide (TPR) repeat protein